MATGLLSKSPQEIIDLLNGAPINPSDFAIIQTLIGGLVAESKIPSAELGNTPTWSEVLAWLNSPFIDLTKKTYLTRAIAVASDGGLLTSFTPPPDSHPPNPGGTPSELLDWVRAAARGFFEEVYDSEVNAAKGMGKEVANLTEVKAVVINVLFVALEKTLTKIADYMSAGTPLAAKLAAHTINQISGTHIDEEAIERDFSVTPNRASVVDIGAQFGEVLDKMFPIPESAEGEKDRGNRQFARDNVNAYFGTNLNFQLRSLAIGTVASLFPGHALNQFENLHQSINWAYGFGWLSWTVLSAVMGVTTTKPLTEYYNSKIKGNDFTEQQAINAFIEKHIDESTLTKILDNHGIRDDIRKTKIEMDRKGLTTEQAVKALIEGWIDQSKFDAVMDRERIREDERPIKVALALPNLSESDVQDLYNNGLYTESDVRKHYQQLGFQSVTLQAKIDLVKDQRMFALQKGLSTAYHHGFVAGTVPEAEYEQYLNSIHYNALEVNIELKRAEIESRGHANKHLTQSQIIHLMTHGGITASEALARVMATGLPEADARILLADAVLEFAVGQIPKKIRDECLGQQVEQNLLSAAITASTELDPTYPLRNKDFFAQAQCILQALVAGSGGTGGTVPPPVPLPGPPPLVHDLPLTQVDTHYADTVWAAIRAAVPVSEATAAWMTTPIGSQAMLSQRFAVPPV